MACVVAVSVSIWMLTGLIGSSDSTTQSPDDKTVTSAAAVTAVRVAVRTSRATSTTLEIAVSARTEPNRMVELRAETDGRVISLGAERGAAVAAGDKIAVLDMRDRQARLEEARANFKLMELQLQAARKLQQQQFVSETQIAEAYARVVAARAALQAIEQDIDRTTMAAPFDAVMQERMVEMGDYVKSGDKVAQLVDTDPLIVVGEVNENEIGKVEIGGVGYARLVSGEVIDGRIRYIAPLADENTRTFRVELAIPNKVGALRAGMTAEMRLAGQRSTVHFFSPALLTLDDSGVIGVKTVDNSNRVRFYPVEIIDSSENGVSVGGLPEEIRLIVVGQGFVRNGDLVIPVSSPVPAGFSMPAPAEQSRIDSTEPAPQG